MTNQHTLTDDQLVMMYANGNNEAFDVLLERYKTKIYTYIFYSVRDEDAANDLFQETFEKVIVRIQSRKYAANGKFAAWITRIAHNLVIDFFRDRQMENVVSNDDVEYDLLNNATLVESSREVQLVHDQTLRDVKLLCDLIPDNQREIVMMRFYQNMSFKEIADKLDISINTALGRMRYALINMRRIATEKNISLSLS